MEITPDTTQASKYFHTPGTKETGVIERSTNSIYSYGNKYKTPGQERNKSYINMGTWDCAIKPMKKRQ